MSEVTNVGVGSFSGSGILEVSIPGLQENVNLDCNWDFGRGLLLCILALVSMTILSFLGFFHKILEKLGIRLN
jgi:hypothetical protein